MIVFVLAEVEVGSEKEVSRALAMVTGVTEVYVLAGEDDVLVKIDVEEPEEALDLIMDKIRKISGIEGTRTIFAKKIK